MNYGAGIITTRLAGYLFNREAGINVQLIPYKGSAEVVQGLLTGAVDYIIDGTASSLPLITSGNSARSQSSTTGRCRHCPMCRRLRSQPACRRSTTCRAGSRSWRRPARRAPSSIGCRARSSRHYADPATADKLEKAGINPVSSTPEEFDAFFRKEAGRWEKAFQESGIKLD